MKKKTKQKTSGFRKGIMFGFGFVLIIAVFVGVVMSHLGSSDSIAPDDSYDRMEQHNKSMHSKTDGYHSMMHNDSAGYKMGCMDLDDGLSEEEQLAEMDKNDDGKCDFCGMPTEHCIKMMHRRGLN